MIDNFCESFGETLIKLGNGRNKQTKLVAWKLDFAKKNVIQRKINNSEYSNMLRF
jgi:hypothetical protein